MNSEGSLVVVGAMVLALAAGSEAAVVDLEAAGAKQQSRLVHCQGLL
jgi:hypothetical protein